VSQDEEKVTWNRDLCRERSDGTKRTRSSCGPLAVT